MGVGWPQRGAAPVIVWLEIDGKRRKVEFRPADGGSASSGALNGELECVVDGRPLLVNVQSIKPGVLSLLVGGRQYRCVLDGASVLVNDQRSAFEVSDPRSLQTRVGVGAGQDGARPVKAPMPGRVVRVLVQVGDEVDAQQGLVVIEAMKMQNELKAPKAGRVIRVAVAEGDAVQAGGLLVVVE